MSLNCLDVLHMQYDLLCRSKSYTILNQKLIELNVNSLDFWLGSGNTVKRQFECSCNWHVSCINTCLHSHWHAHAHAHGHLHAHVGVSDAKLIKCIITTICNLLRSYDNADTKRQRERERSKECGRGSGSRKVVLLLLQLQVLPTTMTSIVCDAVCVCVCVWESETEKRAGASAWRERKRVCESARNWTCEIIERRHENKA